MTEEGKKERELYLKSFELAVKELDASFARSDRDKVYSRRAINCYNAMRKDGRWNGEWLAETYILVVGKISTLSNLERRMVLLVGSKAREIYDNKLNKE